MALIERVLVVGGGVGGMSAAILLRRQGLAVDLIEQNPSWAPDGAGITISGPSLRALREVGVIDEVLARCGWWRHIDICDADGQVLNTAPLAPAIGAEDLPSAGGIMRPVLADILGQATRAAGAVVRLGLSFESIEQDADGVDVLFSDGSRGRYDLVIGADGVHSKVRRHVLPDFPGPRFTGQGSWRAVVPRTRQNSTIFMGKTTKAGLNPVSETESYLFVLDKRAGMDFIAPEEWPVQLAALLEEFGGPIGEIRQGLLEGTLPDPRVLYRPLAGHLIDLPWHRGRVVLLGDAIHATTPHLASGACIGIEDALVLAQELEPGDGLDAALQRFENRRWERCRMVVENSGRLGEIEITGGDKAEHARIMRDSLMSLAEPV